MKRQPGRGRWRIRTIRGGKWFRERGQKGLSFLPHLFTLLNLAFGLFSMIVASEAGADASRLKLAALLVGGSLLADGLDGRLARMVKADGEFGKELDSLADVVAFGTAPAFLMYKAALHDLLPAPWAMAIAAVFPVCGALRLARFNIIKTSGFFIGMPITAGGTLIASLVFYAASSNLSLHSWAYPVILLAVGYLMICTIPYPDFKKFRGARFRWIEWVVPLAVVVYSLVRDPRSVIFLPLVTYAVLGPWLYLLRKWADRIATRPAGGAPRGR